MAHLRCEFGRPESSVTTDIDAAQQDYVRHDWPS